MRVRKSMVVVLGLALMGVMAAACQAQEAGKGPQGHALKMKNERVMLTALGAGVLADRYGFTATDVVKTARGGGPMCENALALLGLMSMIASTGEWNVQLTRSNTAWGGMSLNLHVRPDLFASVQRRLPAPGNAAVGTLLSGKIDLKEAILLFLVADYFHAKAPELFESRKVGNSLADLVLALALARFSGQNWTVYVRETPEAERTWVQSVVRGRFTPQVVAGVGELRRARMERARERAGMQEEATQTTVQTEARKP